jgi:hypothetical protein
MIRASTLSKINEGNYTILWYIFFSNLLKFEVINLSDIIDYIYQ